MIFKKKRYFIAFVLIFLTLLIPGLYLLDRYDIPSCLILRAEQAGKKFLLTLNPTVITDQEIFTSIYTSPLCPETLKKAIDEENYQLAWHEYWKLRARHTTSKVLVDPQTLSNLINFLKEQYPDELRKIIGQADEYIVDHFSPFGTETVKLGSDFSWTKFPRGKNDIIFVWEINTLQHFTLLAQAYLFTEDKKYFNTIVRHLDSWLKENPIENSVNWKEAMEVSMRLHSLIWAGEMLAPDDRMKDAFPLLTKSIYSHAKYVAEHMDRPRRRNNHGIFAAIGLYFFAINYPEFDQSLQWKNYAEQRILDELKLQYTANGVHKEFAPTYHLILLDSYLQYLVSKIKLNDLYQMKLFS